VAAGEEGGEEAAEVMIVKRRCQLRDAPAPALPRWTFGRWGREEARLSGVRGFCSLPQPPIIDRGRGREGASLVRDLRVGTASPQLRLYCGILRKFSKTNSALLYNHLISKEKKCGIIEINRLRFSITSRRESACQ
jgi:hypothetical protein